jgi:hypothetical protein
VSATVDAVLREEGHHLGNTEPFQWLWSMVQYSPFRLAAGDHYLNIFIHEDGLRIDQFMLSAAHRSGETRAFRANYEPGAQTAWQKAPGPPAHISFDAKSVVLSPVSPPDVKVALRRLRPATGRATLRVSLEGAGLGGKDWRVLSSEVDLAKLPEALWVPLSFAGLKIDALDRREYMLRAELIVDGKAVAAARETMLKPFLWEAIGPLDFMENSRKGPFDGTTDPDPRDSRKWVPVKESSLDHLGVIDFGLHTTGNSANAPANVTAYARTRVSVPDSGEYVLLIQSDDAMLLWIDGKRVYQFEDDYGRPVTRSAARRKVSLDAGEHEVRMRVNQTERFWQATVRIRNGKDDLCNVVGLPLR